LAASKRQHGRDTGGGHAAVGSCDFIPGRRQTVTLCCCACGILRSVGAAQGEPACSSARTTIMKASNIRQKHGWQQPQSNWSSLLMTRTILFSTLVLSLASLAGPVSAGPGASGHSHDTHFSAGEPGDSKKPARIVQVTANEGSGKMMFIPDRVEIKRGEQIKFVSNPCLTGISQT